MRYFYKYSVEYCRFSKIIVFLQQNEIKIDEIWKI